MAQNGDNGLTRLIQHEPPRKRDDQLDPFDQANSVNVEDYLQFIISQLHYLLDNQTSVWFNRPKMSIKDLAECCENNTADIQRLLTAGAGGGPGPTITEELLGAKDGENRIFTTSQPFQNFPGKLEPKVYHNGRRIFEGKQFRVLDSGLPEGYDTIHMLGWSPMQSQSVLTVEYTPAQRVTLQDTYMGIRSILGSLKNP